MNRKKPFDQWFNETLEAETSKQQMEGGLPSPLPNTTAAPIDVLKRVLNNKKY